MRIPLLPTVLLALAACASNWTVVGEEDHSALRSGARIVTSERGRGVEHERRTEIRVDGRDVAAHTVDRVMSYARPIDTPEAAIAYSELVRKLAVADSGAQGLVVRPDPTIDGRGSGGRYSRADAAAWGIDFEPTATPYAGGFEVSRVVLFAPIAHQVLTHVASPWRLVRVREVVFKDGTIRKLQETTLSNGQDAARYAER
jgi:hypothetical protein